MSRSLTNVVCRGGELTVPEAQTYRALQARATQIPRAHKPEHQPQDDESKVSHLNVDNVLTQSVCGG